MAQFIADLRVASRAIVRHRSFAAVAVLTLALGVGATSAIFTVVYGVLLKPLPYDRPDELIAIGQTQKSQPQEPVGGSVAPANFADWKRLATSVSHIALYSGSRAIIGGEEGATLLRAGIVTPGFFDVFNVRPVLGRDFTEDENRPSGPLAAIISHGLWMDMYGGSPDVLSRTIEVSGRPRPIVGVAPPGFDFPSQARVWFPLRNDDAQCGRGCVYTNGIARLAPGAGIEAARAEFRSIAEYLEREYPANSDVTIAVQNLRDRTVGSVKLGLTVLFVAVGMVLLIACANVANLLLVRGAARHAEIAVRAALGAGRHRIVAALLAESLVLATAGGVCGILIAAWGVDLLTALAPSNLPRLDAVSFGAPALAFAFGLVGLTTVLFGLAPAIQLSRVPLVSAMGQRGTVGARRGTTKSTLLVAEVALSLVLLLGAGLLLRSLDALQTTDPGFRADGLTVVTLSLPAARYPAAQAADTHDRIDGILGAIPGVTGVARIAGLPLGTSENVQTFRRLDRPAPPDGQMPSALYRVVDAEYFAVMGVPVLEGRTFAATDRAGTPRAVVISRRMAQEFWPGESAVGKPISIADNDGTVVGVVADVRSQGLSLLAAPEMYEAHAQAGGPTMTYVLRSALPAAQVLTGVREVMGRFDRGLPLIDPASMADLLDEQLARPRFYVVLLSLFAVLAAVLAAVGVYGVVAYVVAERTREIGVRMALGATRAAVIRMVLWQGLRPALLGICVGLVVALGFGRVVETLLVGITPHDPLTFVGVTVGLLAVVGIASAWPARRASAVPPVEALRGE